MSATHERILEANVTADVEKALTDIFHNTLRGLPEPTEEGPQALLDVIELGDIASLVIETITKASGTWRGKKLAQVAR